MVEGTIKFYPKFNRSYYIFTYFNFFITKTLVFKSHQFKLKITVKNGRFRETVQVKNKSCVLLRIILYSGIGRPPPPVLHMPRRRSHRFAPNQPRDVGSSPIPLERVYFLWSSSRKFRAIFHFLYG